MQKQNAELRKTATPEAETATRFVYSVGDLAALVGVSDRTIHRLVGQGMPQLGHGKYDACACVQWLIERERGTQAEGSDRSEQIRTELVEAQRDRVRLEIEQLRGTLIPHDLVSQTLARIASLTAAALDGMPPRLAGELADIDDPATVQTVLFRETRATRSAIAEAMRELASGIETCEADEG